MPPRHGLEKSVVAIKAHRHFDLSPNEAMLEQPDGDPRGGTSIRPVARAKIAQLGARPNVIAMGPKRHWYPVNYYYGKFCPNKINFTSAGSSNFSIFYPLALGISKKLILFLDFSTR